jgi:GNAT superfamily N-acetyltransferase
MTDTAILAALEATWPAAQKYHAGPWVIRDGKGGGQRVSAASILGAWANQDIAIAESEMAKLGQSPLFMLTPKDSALDTELAKRGYRRHDPVVIYSAKCAVIVDGDPEPLSGFPHWPPLAVAIDLWADGGIGAARLAVMERVAGPKAAILGRLGDRPAGAGFVAVSDGIAALHALEVAAAHRRKGLGQSLVRHAAYWAANNGADTLVLAVTEMNSPAREMYDRLGLIPVGQYHYRVR